MARRSVRWRSRVLRRGYEARFIIDARWRVANVEAPQYCRLVTPGQAFSLSGSTANLINIRKPGKLNIYARVFGDRSQPYVFLTLSIPSRSTRRSTIPTITFFFIFLSFHSRSLGRYFDNFIYLEADTLRQRDQRSDFNEDLIIDIFFFFSFSLSLSFPRWKVVGIYGALPLSME